MTLNISNFKEGYGYFKLDDVSEKYMMAAFLVILAVSGNFLAETLGCPLQKLLDNMIFKNLLIYFTIYFTIEISSSEAIAESPIKTGWNALIVWTLFKFFTRMHIIPTIIVILLGVSIFIITQYNKSVKKRDDDEALVKKLSLVQQILYNSIIFIICVSVIVYYIQKRQEYKGRFSFLTFLFGVKNCKSLK